MLARVDLGVHPRRAVLVLVPQLVPVHAPLAKVSRMDRGLITNRTGKVGRIPVIVIPTRGGGVRR